MIENDVTYLDQNHDLFKASEISGRYITLPHILPLLKKLPKELFAVSELGSSFNGQSIYKIQVGNGSNRILFWSQMHGNESTGTKALFDLFNFLRNPLELNEFKETILKECTLTFIPILNPDGAVKYDRKNAQGIDLNRDILDLKAPESRLLVKELKEFNPQYCFNLHDQRTIFSVGKDNNTATMSFLAPSVNKEREVTKGRIKTMEVIAGIVDSLQTLLPGKIGRYTDEFYKNATGDNFQKMGHHTILVEAGHYKGDYEREITRKYNFISLLLGIKEIINRKTIPRDYTSYFKIPENKEKYLDKIYTHVTINGVENMFGIYKKEKLISNKIQFVPIIEKEGDLSDYNADSIVSDTLHFNSKPDFESYLLKNV